MASHSHEDGAWVIPLGRKGQATEETDDELQAPKVNNFAKGEATAV
jgi:hypothetical protein